MWCLERFLAKAYDGMFCALSVVLVPHGTPGRVRAYSSCASILGLLSATNKRLDHYRRFVAKRSCNPMSCPHFSFLAVFGRQGAEGPAFED